MNLQSLNPYTYCMNNPLKYIDPNGESPWDYMALPDGAVAPDEKRLEEYMREIESGDHNFDEETVGRIREWSHRMYNEKRSKGFLDAEKTEESSDYFPDFSFAEQRAGAELIVGGGTLIALGGKVIVATAPTGPWGWAVGIPVGGAMIVAGGICVVAGYLTMKDDEEKLFSTSSGGF